MKLVKKKGLIITHNDADGVGCALALQYGMGDIIDFNIHYCKIGEQDETLINEISTNQYQYVYITDLSLTVDTWWNILLNHHSNAIKNEEEFHIIHIDHHPSNTIFKLMQTAENGDPILKYIVHNRETIYIDIRRSNVSLDKGMYSSLYENPITKEEIERIVSATYLTNKYLLTVVCKNDPERATKLQTGIYISIIHAIDWYDTWFWKSSYVTEHDEISKITNHHEDCYSLLCFDMKQEDFFKALMDMLNDYDSNPACIDKYRYKDFYYLPEELAERVDVLYSEISDSIEESMKYSAIYMDKFGNYIFSVMYNKNISYISEYVYEKYPFIDIVQFIMLSNCGLSFRTNRDTINLTEYAEMYGGGGHPKASGANNIPTDTYRDILYIHVQSISAKDWGTSGSIKLIATENRYDPSILESVYSNRLKNVEVESVEE